MKPTPEPLAPASVVKGSCDAHAQKLTLDELCRVMRPRALAFARAHGVRVPGRTVFEGAP